MTQFDAQPVDPYAEPPKNTIGMVGFIVSMASILTCGIIAPIGLILSFIGLFKNPKGFAIAGTIGGLVMSLIAGIGVVFLILAWGYAEQGIVINAGEKHIPQFYANNGRLPTKEEFDQFVQTDVAQIEQSIGGTYSTVYEYEIIDSKTVHLTTPGFDKKLGTADDETTVIDASMGGLFAPPATPDVNGAEGDETTDEMDAY